MPDITVSITDTEQKALEYVCLDPSEWVGNATTERARIATEKIIALLVAHCNANDIQLATGQDAQVTQAYTLGVVDTAANRNAADSSP